MISFIVCPHADSTRDAQIVRNCINHRTKWKDNFLLIRCEGQTIHHTTSSFSIQSFFRFSCLFRCIFISFVPVPLSYRAYSSNAHHSHTHTQTDPTESNNAMKQNVFRIQRYIQIYDAFSQSGRCCADRSFLNKIIIKSIYSVLLFGVVVRAWQWGRSTLINVEVMNWQWSLRLPTTTTTSTNSTDERRH